MAKIIYALSGEGRGHTSRGIAISDELRRCGDEVLFCCGGTAREILEARGERVLPAPALRQVIQENEVQLARTIACNWRHIFDMPNTVARLADLFASERADLLITDFEAFSPRAARRIGLPVISFNHQQVVTETKYQLPMRYWLNALFIGAAIKLIAPSDPEHILLTSFFFPPVKDPARTTLAPPIIRPSVKALTPTRGEHVLVYYNQTERADYVVDELRRIPGSFILYNFPIPEHPEDYPNLLFKEPSLEGFLEDLASSKAVICTAGFTLISEALYLGKPLLVVPNRGIFEQTLNALFLEREGMGMSVTDRSLTAGDVHTFLSNLDTYRKRLRNRRASGNKEAVSCIQQVLSRRASRPSLPASIPQTSTHRPPLATSIDKQQ